MKKIKFILCSLLVLIVLCSCGNKNYGFGNYEFNYIHNTVTDECYELKSWIDNEMGIEVKTAEYGSLYFSEGTYILVEDECPICSKRGD